MPLLKGKKNIGRNIEVEQEAGKSPKQSLAIALSVSRRNKKKMAKGGEITADTEKRPMPDDEHDDAKDIARTLPSKKVSGWLDNKKEAGNNPSVEDTEVDDSFVSDRRTSIDQASTPEEMRMKKGPSTDPKHVNADHLKMAEGGEVEEHYSSIADAILAKSRRSKMADGGQVDLSLNATEGENLEDDLSWDALRKENYSESEGLEELSSPSDSGQHGDSLEDEDEHGESLVDSIRRKKKNSSK